MRSAYSRKFFFASLLNPFFGGDLPQLVVDLVPCRRVAEDLVAERDGVVEVPAVRVEVNRLLVVVDGLIRLVEAQVQVADAIVDRDVVVFLTLGMPDDLQIDLESPIELLFSARIRQPFF